MKIFVHCFALDEDLWGEAIDRELRVETSSLQYLSTVVYLLLNKWSSSANMGLHSLMCDEAI